MSVVIANSDADKAVAAIHKEFLENPDGPVGK